MDDFSVFQTGGKQYLVKSGDEVKIEKLDEEVGKKVTFDEVLLTSKGGKVVFGKPIIEKATVKAEIIDQMRDKKIVTNKFKAKSRYRKRQGHRQSVTMIKITNI